MPKLKITGVREIDRAFRLLPDRVAKKVVRQAMRESLKPVAAAVKANTPRRSGELKKHIKIRAGRRKKDRIKLVVMFGGKGDYKGKHFYGAFPEYGTKAGGKGGKRRTSGHATGKGGQKAQHFVLKAFKRTKARATAQAKQLITAGTIREAGLLRTLTGFGGSLRP